MSKCFLNNVIGFNSFFCFVSFVTSSKLENAAESAFCYKIQGKIYHRIGLLKPHLMGDGGMFKDLEVPFRDNNKFWNSNRSFLDLRHIVEQ